MFPDSSSSAPSTILSASINQALPPNSPNLPNATITGAPSRDSRNRHSILILSSHAASLKSPSPECHPRGEATSPCSFHGPSPSFLRPLGEEYVSFSVGSHSQRERRQGEVPAQHLCMPLGLLSVGGGLQHFLRAVGCSPGSLACESSWQLLPWPPGSGQGFLCSDYCRHCDHHCDQWFSNFRIAWWGR